MSFNELNKQYEHYLDELDDLSDEELRKQRRLNKEERLIEQYSFNVDFNPDSRRDR